MTAGWRGGPNTKKKARSRNADPGPCPTKAALDEAALTYLGRGAATAKSLTRVLEQKIARWARKVERWGKGPGADARDPEALARDLALAQESIEAIVARFREVGLINDTTFAEARVRSLSARGRSRRAIAAHLAAKGVDAETAKSALPNDARVELAAALAFARKRRIGPFAREDRDNDEVVGREVGQKTKQKALAAMARAGFDWNVCERVFRMDREQADDHIREGQPD